MKPLIPQTVYVETEELFHKKPFYFMKTIGGKDIYTIEKENQYIFTKEELQNFLCDFKDYDRKNPTVKSGLPLNDDYEKIYDYIDNLLNQQ